MKEDVSSYDTILLYFRFPTPSIPRIISYHLAAVCLVTPAPRAMARKLVTSGWNFMYVPNCKPPHKSLATARKQLYNFY